MNNTNSHLGLADPKDFWDSLQTDILASSQNYQSEDFLCLIERDFVYSLLFRGYQPLEQIGYQILLNIKNFGYVILMDFSDSLQNNSNGVTIDEFKLYRSIKKRYPDKFILMGPLIVNRICLLLFYEAPSPGPLHKEESISFCEDLMKDITDRFHIPLSIGIGSQQSLNTIYTSFIDALSSLYFQNTGSINYYTQTRTSDSNIYFDYPLTERHLIESIRLRKSEAYDYFGMIMDWIRLFNDDTKRNKILEILVLSNHAMSIDSQRETRLYNYTSYVKDFMTLSGDQLIEFAYRNFLSIISYAKPQSNIDYSNRIVKATQEYLEAHFAEDISLEDVAEQVNISAQYFSKLIKKTTGFNFIDWLSMLRVKKAKELLTNTNLTVKEVCFMVGYKDPNYFSRIFKKRIGITPSEYIKTNSYLSNHKSSSY